MYRYKYNTSYHNKSKRARHVGVFAIVFSVVVVAGVGAVVAEIVLQKLRKQTPVSQATYSSVQGSSINLFRTEYYQFQTDNSWREVPSETKKNHFVYASYKGPLVEHDLTIDINDTTKIPDALSRTTNIMPVQIEANGRLTIVAGVGEHCKNALPKNTPNLPIWVTQKQVKFLCTPDAVLYQVQVGVIGGGTSMKITRPDGSKASYSITYRNLRFTPDDNMLRQLIDGFQAR